MRKAEVDGQLMVDTSLLTWVSESTTKPMFGVVQQGEYKAGVGNRVLLAFGWMNRFRFTHRNESGSTREHRAQK